MEGQDCASQCSIRYVSGPWIISGNKRRIDFVNVAGFSTVLYVPIRQKEHQRG